ncbi:hypothetical protein F1188_00845 [Roseospira marina]|uniref:Uncharacterized protein n=1 Tax=Roseospira marina TaxID=140057 RepID=A0A5M6IGB0_9PROT|nr:hypothetical protein F1188_00845 [Roseospira marina]
MATKPILFSGPMARVLLDGRKTQTRRALAPQPFSDAYYDGDVEAVVTPPVSGCSYVGSPTKGAFGSLPLLLAGARCWKMSAFCPTPRPTGCGGARCSRWSGPWTLDGFCTAPPATRPNARAMGSTRHTRRKAPSNGAHRSTCPAGRLASPCPSIVCAESSGCAPPRLAPSTGRQE